MQAQVSKTDSSEDEYEYEQEDDFDLIQIKLLSSVIEVKYSHLCKYSRLIPTRYLITDISDQLSFDLQEYVQENHINEDNIHYFFKTFNDEKLIITSERYRDLFKLSEFFQINPLLKRLKNTRKNTLKTLISSSPKLSKKFKMSLRMEKKE